MHLGNLLKAAARGEISAEPLLAYGRANTEAYALVDELPRAGAARLAAWCAFVLQAHGDNLISCEPTPGWVQPGTFYEVHMLYQLTAAWLTRAHAAAADPGYRLDVVVPQRLPVMPHERSDDQLVALKKTLETVQARLGTDIEAHRNDPIHARFAPFMLPLQTALDVAGAVTRQPGMIRGGIGNTLHDGIDRGYQLGQLLAMPELFGAVSPPDRVLPAPSLLSLFLPGDPAFDPWCLTDPAERARLEQIPTSCAKLDRLWLDDPDPGRTIAIRGEILWALERGAAAYLPIEPTVSLKRLTRQCPWPSVLFAREPFRLAGTELAAGDRFVFTAGMSRAGFRRGIVRIPHDAAAKFAEEPDDPAGRERLRVGSLLGEFGEAGLDVRYF